MAKGTPRLTGAQTSAMVAEARLTPGLAKVPAKNLHMVRAVMFGENPAPMVNRAKIGMVVRYTALRPKVSDIGEETTGPNAIPRL